MEIVLPKRIKALISKSVKISDDMIYVNYTTVISVIKMITNLYSLLYMSLT